MHQNSREFNYDNFGKFKIKQMSSTKNINSNFDTNYS